MRFASATSVLEPPYLHFLSSTSTSFSHVHLSSPRQLNQLLSRVVVSDLVDNPGGLVAVNSLLRRLSRSPSPALAASLFDAIKAIGFSADDYTFTSALKAAARIAKPDFGRNLHSLIFKLSFHLETFVLNSLIHFYFTHGLSDDARKMFDWAPRSILDVVSWNSMISGYVGLDMKEKALEMFREMRQSLTGMDGMTPAAVLTACSKAGDLDTGRKVHSLVIVNGINLDFFVGSSLISMYGKFRSVHDARNVFDRMPDRNNVCWTSIISVYSHSGLFMESIQLYRKMQVEGVKPDHATIASVLSSCAQLGALDLGRYIHGFCDSESEISTNLNVKNALMDMYLKCGDVVRARRVFDSLAILDVFSWTVMISGLAINCRSNEALDLFSAMEVSRETKPNEITFLGVLTACSHGGLLDEGFYYFTSMTEIYNLTPKIEHYGCIVDLLGRAKLVREAEKFIKEMPIEPDAIIWRSLLFACGTCGTAKMDFIEFVAEKIVDLGRDRCGGAVLLSNIYASASLWGEANRVRRDMKDLCIWKKPGCSVIEVDGVVNEFLSSDASHPQTEFLYGVLKCLSAILSETILDEFISGS